MRPLTPLIIATLVGLASPAIASPKEDAHVVLIAWSEAYAARDHAALANLHAPLGHLRGMDDVRYISREAISEFYYFDADKTKAQSVTFVSHDCQIFDDGNFKDYLTGLCSGIYELKQTLTSGETIVRPARFSMALVVEDNRWMIYDHNTSWLPVVVAGCGASVPPDKAAIATGTSSQPVASLCSEPTKTGALGTLPLIKPVGATVTEPTK